MLNPHASVAIAQLVFYAVLPPVTLYILVRNWRNRPRLAWYPLFAFSLIRVAGAITVIIQNTGSNEANLRLIITSLVLLNVGVIPLVVSSFSLVRLLHDSSKGLQTLTLRILLKVMRVLIIVSVSLLGSAGGLIVSADAGTASTGKALSKAGYLSLVAIMVLLDAIFVFIWQRRNLVASEDQVYLRGALLALPFLVLRAVYGILYTFQADVVFGMWDPLFGSAIAFALMALFPEYIVVCNYIYLGFCRIRQGKSKVSRTRGSEEAQLESLVKENAEP